jgi:hypothetical protein
VDPVAVLSQLHRFGQPSEVAEPIELLRAGVVFHARGLMNTRAIQHNLDWVWPFWVERQFDPADEAFIPRAFSITHVNLTHRNWTAVGLPDCARMPIVDPRGLVTPLWDGWSLDAWILSEDGRQLLPSRLPSVTQALDLSGGLAVATDAAMDGLSVSSRVDVVEDGRGLCCRVRLRALADAKAWAFVALRPCNPEGVSFVHEVAVEPGGSAWTVNGEEHIWFDTPPDGHQFSDYRSSDVHVRLPASADPTGVRCDVGLATAAAVFDLAPGDPREMTVRVSLAPPDSPRTGAPGSDASRWDAALAGACRLRVPDERFQFLHDAALRTLVIHSPGDVFAGPYTYKRFWFRDAAFILHALLVSGLADRVERALDRFPGAQRRSGFFHSQDGEWDSNGEALWILARASALTGRKPKDSWVPAIERGTRWIGRKRMRAASSPAHAGLLPAGFSAEHLGPIDHYYWDDFWGVAGLLAGADLLEATGSPKAAERHREEARDFMGAIERSLALAAARLGRSAMPAAPSRRLDSGAVGSLAVGYPLGLWPADDPRLLDTAAYLLDFCFFDGGFFQDLIHSGINAYLTLHVAQVLMRAGDRRAFDLLSTVASLASPTGQWPEAVHPRTRGGCMGDGQHAWAAAEWVLAMRNAFVREEGSRLVLAQGLPPRWLASGTQLSYGPTLTPHGPLTVQVERNARGVRVQWIWTEGGPRGGRPEMVVHLAGRAPVTSHGDETLVEVAP